MENPNPEQLDQMILTFDTDEQGRAIFATMDEELLATLFKLYDERRVKKAQ